MTKVKICGITNLDDALTAQRAGADFLGFVFAKSPRQIDVAKAAEIIGRLSPATGVVALFVNEAKATVDSIINNLGRVDILQFHGDEDPSYCSQFTGRKIMKAFRVKGKESMDKISDYKEIDYILLDAYNKDIYGGAGKSFDWKLAAKAKEFNKDIFLSGGLTPDNVAGAILEVRPFCVDVSSGVEKTPGEKDPELVKKFIKAAKAVREEE